MDLSKKYVVAQCFDSDGGLFIEAAPGSWFRENCLFWPKSQKNLRLRSVLGRKVNLDEPGGWTACPIKSIKGLFDSYPDACQSAAALVCYEDTEEEQQNQVKLSKKRTAFLRKEPDDVEFQELEQIMESAVAENIDCSESGYSFVEEDPIQVSLSNIDVQDANSMPFIYQLEETNDGQQQQPQIVLPGSEELQKYINSDTTEAICE